MFGGNTTSTWGSSQQNQQQQPQQPGAFGQPSAFGTTGFGSGGVFGQPQQQQQQQPQANPMFGNLGAPAANPSATTGFGTFGSTNPSQGTTTNSVFGAPKPAAGFGAFGGNSSAFGGGSAFGQPANVNTAGSSSTGTGLFGQNNNTGAFGTSTGSAFNGNKPATSFGVAATTTPATAPVTTGSSNPPYSVTNDRDNSTPNVNLQYQAISCMPAYASSSFEELRVQDYAQGRKTASVGGGAFGQPSAFGATQPATTGLFGAQPTQQNAQPSVFGGATNTSGTTGFGAFGQPTSTAPAAPASTGMFGGTFGQQPQQQQQTQGFGAFGQPATQPVQQPASGSLFGGGGGAFGTATSKPAFSTFGAGTGNTFGGSGTFGQSNQQQQPAGGLFGGSQPTSTNTGFGGAFGSTNTNAPKPSIFGASQPATAQPAQGFGLFGQQQQNQQQPQTQQPLFGAGGGLFGNNTQQQQGTQQAAPSLFGNTSAQPATGPGIFGGGGLLNNQQQQQNQQQPGQAGGFGSFGNKPAAPATQPLFGAFNQPQSTNTAPQQGLFSSTLGQSANQQSALGGSLFGGNKLGGSFLGSTPSNGQSGLYGSFNASNGALNASATNPGAQGSLTASISQPIGQDIFSLLPPGPRAVNLELSQPKKKAGFFVDVPTRSPVPRVQLGYTPANSKLRGFGSTNIPTSSSGGGNPFSALAFSSGKANALSLSRADNTPGPDSLGRSSSPALGSGGRHSVKKLILDKKVEPSDLFSKSGGSPRSIGKVTFSPALSVAVREKEAATAVALMNRPGESPTPVARTQRSPNRFTAQSTQNIKTNGQDTSGPATLEEGDYWVKPDLETLKKAGYDELSSFNGLVVGRVGYGEIHFLEPVDLTGLAKLGALLGEVVRFDDKECSVYSDSEEVDKPPPGSGLNVRARMSLLRCWTVDKATREPIKDATYPMAVKHLKRLKNMKDTHFEGFDIDDGKWTFTVDHF